MDPLTGNSTLVGPTGIPAVPFVPQTSNPDGSFNFYDESLFSVGGHLYATFDAGTFNPATFQLTSVISAALYLIDPTTGVATFIAPTYMGLSTVTGANGTAYAFSAATHQILTLRLTDGQTNSLGNLDPGVGIIAGAVATPEPGSVWLACCGLAGLALVSRIRR